MRLCLLTLQWGLEKMNGYLQFGVMGLQVAVYGFVRAYGLVPVVVDP